MSANSENRNIEMLFEEVMPGYRCAVSRQPEGAINFQFQCLSSHQTITFPAVDCDLWDSPEKLQALCEQIVDEFQLLCESVPLERVAIQVTNAAAERLHAIVHSLNGR
jgi:hypothetical protein